MRMMKVNFISFFPVLTAWALFFSPAVSAAAAATSCAGCPPMVVVGPGSFVMGDDGLPAERPAHRVAIERAFAIGRHEVTFDEWQKCVDDGACKGGIDDHGWGRGRRPVINVSWHDVDGFVRWLSAKSGRACRLPSEAEWEFAARAGTTTAFWWGDRVGDGKANCRDCVAGPPRYGSAEIGSFPANPWGLFDMNGNVWEWTNDCWTPSHDGAASAGSCQRRVIKGGAWYYYHSNARAAARAGNDARGGSYTIGFRPLCELDQ
jgi:formylglycine-generating enzyme required for sulfatase activity